MQVQMRCLQFLRRPIQRGLVYPHAVWEMCFEKVIVSPRDFRNGLRKLPLFRHI
jgi:hypothetical protein